MTFTEANTVEQTILDAPIGSGREARRVTWDEDRRRPTRFSKTESV